MVIGEDASAAAARLAAAPFVPLARDRPHATEIIAERHERFGFDSFTTHEPDLETLGDLISAYR